MEALLELLRNVIVAILGPLADLVRDQVIQRLSEPAYLSGFLWGLATAALVGSIVRQLAYCYGKVQGLLAPSKEPVMKDGPSQYQKATSTTREFTRSVVVLLLMILLAVCLLSVVYLAVAPAQ